MIFSRTLVVSILLSIFGSLMVAVTPFVARAAKTETAIEQELKLKAGDEAGNEVKALKTEMLVMHSEKQALAQLQKLQIRYKGTRMEPEILFRLGEIYMRRARTERFFEIHRDSDEVVRFAPQLVKQASEVAQVKKAIKIYLDLEANYPRFRARDVVTFNTAYAYQQMGDDKKAQEQFERLLARHKDSPLVPDSLLALGEIHYSRRQFQVALDLFLKIKDHPQARVYPYGLYKAAWTKYNMQDESGGISLLEEVIAYGHSQVKAADGTVTGTTITANTSKLDLRKEALGDLALFYSVGKNPAKAVDYFIAQARELDPVPYLLKLVDIYERHSKYKEVDIVLRDVLDKKTLSPQIAQVHERLIWNADRQKRRDIAVNQLSLMAIACDELKEKNLERAECDSKLIEVSKKLGAKFHAYWKKDGLNETADYALRAYGMFLSKLPETTDHDSAQVRYATADLMFARGRFREASQNYARVIIATPKFDLMKNDPKLAVDASYGAVVALEKAVGDGKWSDADEAAFRQLGDGYIKRAPAGPYALDLKFKMAFIAYEKEKYDVAAPEFKNIGWANYPTDAAAANPKVLKAQDLYLDILNIKKDYRALKESAQTLVVRGLPDDAKKARETQLGKIQREAWFAEVGEVEKTEPTKAVDLYRAFAFKNEGTDLAPRAWWNGSQILFRVGELSRGATMCSEMFDRFPEDKNTKECLTQAVRTFEAIARVDRAAKVALNLSDLEPNRRVYWRDLALSFYAISGTRDGQDRALKMLLDSVAEAKQRNDQSSLLERATALANELKDEKALAMIRTKTETLGLEPASSRAILEQAEAAYASADSNKAFNLAKRVVGRESALTDKEVPARARFLQARVLEDEYRQQSVKARVDRIGIVLAIKTEKLEKAQKAFQAAAKMGDNGVAIESFDKLSDLYTDYARTVKNMKLPADVPASDQQAFAKEIESIGLPMEEKGIDALNQAVQAARKSARFDGLAGRLQEKLDRLNLKPTATSHVEVETLPRLVPAFGRRQVGEFSAGGGLR